MLVAEGAVDVTIGAIIKHGELHRYNQNHFVFGSHVRNLVGSQKHALTN